MKSSHASSSNRLENDGTQASGISLSKLGSNTEGSINASYVGFDRIELTRCFGVNRENDSGTAKKY